MMNELLTNNQIKAFISANNRLLLTKIEIFATIESTNTYLLNQSKSNTLSGWFCFAEEQTQGRGRQGRTWFSPRGSNIYCSALWRFPDVSKDISALSMAVAVMLVQTLKKYGVAAALHLKWPNDVLVAGRKLAGILLERIGDAVVIGIGVNVALPETANKDWISLAEMTTESLARNKLAGLLVNELLEKIPLFAAEGFNAFYEEWHQHDLLIGKEVDIHTPQSIVTGTVLGVNAAGELLLRTMAGSEPTFRCGEVSVRQVT